MRAFLSVLFFKPEKRDVFKFEMNYGMLPFGKVVLGVGKALFIMMFLAIYMPASAQSLDSLLLTIPNHEDIYVKADMKPQFPGGRKEFNKFISTNLRYPAEAARNAESGIVVLAFIIEADGQLSNFNAVRSPSILLSQESVRVMKKSPKWLPGIKDGKPVRILAKIPILFTWSGDRSFPSMN